MTVFVTISNEVNYKPWFIYRSVMNYYISIILCYTVFIIIYLRTLASEALQAEHIAKTPKRTHSEPLNCFDLRDTLSTYGNTCIPSYSVRALVMERVLGSMWHPSANDLSNIDSITKWKQSLMKL